MRREADGEVRYARSNASPATSGLDLARVGSARGFVECSIRDAKSELGWDEGQALKYRAWQQRYAPDSTLLTTLHVERRPELSVANVRSLLRAVLPLRQLSLSEAQTLAAQRLLNRTRSRKSRLTKQRENPLFHTRDPV